MSSKNAGRRPVIRSLVAVAAFTAVLAGLTGCGGGRPSAGVSPGEVPAEDAPAAADAGAGAPHRWCDDTEWLAPAAEMYVSVYRKKRRPITADTIDADLADQGRLWKAYRRLADRGVSADVHELREFLVSVAAAEDAGTDPGGYARHIVAVCDS
ncbi:hypothetical protein [Actinoallomurus iriomotensis]|uniref:Lipoprotein n=1 Tax=Actinoallomurus iriomotensis TaxID=478107 RepID=A0A9W6VSQ6_9ACTN|nr:hypothetical protein [Actinoallomurus iriomotensis]GLY76851.1 hypothetical protein Airi01_051180 [Actinoallomurus iriomotensis]